MALVKDILTEEYIRLREKYKVYLAMPSDPFRDNILAGIKEDMEFIEKSFSANNIDLYKAIQLFLKDLPRHEEW